MPDQEEGVQPAVEETIAPIPEGEAEVKAETPEPEAKQPELDEFPEDEQKRREAFIRQRQEIKALKAQSRQSDEESGLSVLSQMRDGYQPKVDPITADTDIDQVTQRMTQAELASKEAKNEAQKVRDELDNMRLYREFPELDPENPDSKKPENKALDEYIAGQYLLQRLQGKNPKTIEIARKAKEVFGTLTQSQKEQVAQEAVNQLQKKDQGSLEARGNSVVIPKAQNTDALNDRIRRGDKLALAERLKATVLSNLDF